MLELAKRPMQEVDQMLVPSWIWKLHSGHFVDNFTLNVTGSKFHSLRTPSRLRPPSPLCHRCFELQQFVKNIYKNKLTMHQWLLHVFHKLGSLMHSTLKASG